MDIPLQSCKLALGCLKHMNRNLQYDMKWISAALGPDFKPKSGNHQASALCYAGLHFAEHVAQSVSDLSNHWPLLIALETEISIFLKGHLLHWFELMARLREMYIVEITLKNISIWLEVSMHDVPGA